MKPNQQGINAVLEIASSDLDHQLTPLQLEKKDEIITILQNYLNLTFSYEQSLHSLTKLGIPSDSLDRLREIKNVDEAPIKSNDDLSDDYSHKKSRPWSPLEDTRLLAGIIRYGLENWSTVAMFVGNDRTRAQCSQRWCRGLNPRISKDTWSLDEDNLLIQLVQQYGDKSWTKIASTIGNRSDVQCRYHFHQISKNQPNSFQSAPNPNLNTSNSAQSFPHNRQTPRFSLPNINPSPVDVQSQKLPQQPNQIQQGQQQFINCSPLGFRPLYTGLMQPSAPVMPPPFFMNGMNYPPNASFGVDNLTDNEAFSENEHFGNINNNEFNRVNHISPVAFSPVPSQSFANRFNQPPKFSEPPQFGSKNSNEINIDGFLEMFK